MKNKKNIHFTSSEDPIQVYQKYLESNAKDRKRFQNKLADLKRATNNKGKKNDKSNSSSVESYQINNEEKEIERNNLYKLPTEDTSKQDVSIRRIKKTIIY